MSDARMPPRAAWPPFPWKDSGWWFTASAAAAALAFYLSPRLLDLDARGRVAVAAILAASPAPFLALRYAGAVTWMLGQRIRFYPRLYHLFEQRAGTSDVLSRHLGDSIEGWPRYEILGIHWFRDREDIYFLIRKKGGKQPEIGATFWVYDMETGQPMAVSKMMENRGGGYYAKVVQQVDPVWFGGVKRRDQPEMPPPPGMAAYLVPRRKES